MSPQTLLLWGLKFRSYHVMTLLHIVVSSFSFLILKTSLSVILFNQGEGCGVLRLAGVGNRHAWTAGRDFPKNMERLEGSVIKSNNFPFSWHGGTHALLQTSLKVTPSSLRMGRNILTRPGSRICKRLTRRTRRQSTWSQLGKMCHQEGKSFQFNRSSWRCVHKTGATPMMSTHGKVTDFQMWDHVLPDEQLLKVKTGTGSCSVLGSRWPAAKSFQRATWSAGRKPIGSSTQVAARSQLSFQLKSSASVWLSIQIFLPGSERDSWPWEGCL